MSAPCSPHPPSGPKACAHVSTSAHMFLLLHDRLWGKYRKAVSVCALGGGTDTSGWSETTTPPVRQPAPPSSSVCVPPPASLSLLNNDNVSAEWVRHMQQLLLYCYIWTPPIHRRAMWLWGRLQVSLTVDEANPMTLFCILCFPEVLSKILLLNHFKSKHLSSNLGPRLQSVQQTWLVPLLPPLHPQLHTPIFTWSDCLWWVFTHQTPADLNLTPSESVTNRNTRDRGDHQQQAGQCRTVRWSRIHVSFY